MKLKTIIKEVERVNFAIACCMEAGSDLMQEMRHDGTKTTKKDLARVSRQMERHEKKLSRLMLQIRKQMEV